MPRSPDAERRPVAGAPSRKFDPRSPATKRTATSWVDEEILGVIDILNAARLSAKAGHIPIVQLRRAAVRLVALDAAVADSLDLVDRMRPEAVAHG